MADEKKQGFMSFSTFLIIFIIIGAIMNSCSNSNPKTSPKNEITQNKNVQTSTEKKAESKKDIAEIFSISNWQFSSKQNFHDYNFVVHNVGNLNPKGSVLMLLYVYDKDNVLLKSTNSLVSGSLNAGEKVRVSGTLVGDISTAAWGKIAVRIGGGEEYSSEKWKLNFSDSKATLMNTMQNTKQNIEQLPAGSSSENNSTWATYKDEGFGFSFKYPSNWIAKQGNANTKLFNKGNADDLFNILGNLFLSKVEPQNVTTLSFAKKPENMFIEFCTAIDSGSFFGDIARTTGGQVYNAIDLYLHANPAQTGNLSIETEVYRTSSGKAGYRTMLKNKNGEALYFFVFRKDVYTSHYIFISGSYDNLTKNYANELKQITASFDFWGADTFAEFDRRTSPK